MNSTASYLIKAQKKYTFFFVFLFMLITLYKCYPNLDLYVSNFFYLQSNTFLLNCNVINIITHPYIWFGLCITPFLFLLKKIHLQKMLLTLFYIILTNAIVVPSLKNYWNRARPKEILNFKGDKHYSSPLYPQKNTPSQSHSFVSGHAAGGFSLMIYKTISAYPDFWSRMGITMGLFIGMIRIMQGAHFLSDVLFAYVVIWFSLEILIILCLMMNDLFISQARNDVV